MSDTQAIVDSMSALTDDEVRAVVAAATSGRPALAALRSAALDIRHVPDPGTPPHVLDGHLVDDPLPAASPTSPGPPSGWTDAGVPTFDAVRERIETRAGTAEGAAELDAESASGRTVEERYAARERAARDRLDEIRRSLRGD